MPEGPPRLSRSSLLALVAGMGLVWVAVPALVVWGLRAETEPTGSDGIPLQDERQRDVEGRLHGVYRIRDAEDRVVVAGRYRHGRRVGIWRVQDGPTLIEVHYHDGRPVAKRRWREGADGQRVRHGRSTFWDRSGQVWRVEWWRDGRRIC